MSLFINSNLYDKDVARSSTFISHCCGSGALYAEQTDSAMSGYLLNKNMAAAVTIDDNTVELKPTLVVAFMQRRQAAHRNDLQPAARHKWFRAHRSNQRNEPA